MNIFEQASRLKLRFNFRGNVGVEQLWDVKDSELGDLITYEEQLSEVVESYGKSPRRSASRKTKEQEMNELRLSIVSYILDTRIQEREDAAVATANKAHNQKIMDLIARKKDAELEAMSAEELEKLLK